MLIYTLFVLVNCELALFRLSGILRLRKNINKIVGRALAFMASNGFCTFANGSDGARVVIIAIRESEGISSSGLGFFIWHKK